LGFLADFPNSAAPHLNVLGGKQSQISQGVLPNPDMCTMDEHGRKLKSMCFVVFSSFVEQERKHTLILLEAMPTAEVQPNRISYNAAISSCEKAGEWQRALSLFEAMGTQSLQKVDDSSPKTLFCGSKKPIQIENTKSFQSLKAQTKNNSFCNFENSWTLVAHILQPFFHQVMNCTSLQLDVITCNAVISACEKGFCRKAALKVLEEMVQEQLQPMLGKIVS